MLTNYEEGNNITSGEEAAAGSVVVVVVAEPSTGGVGVGAASLVLVSVT
jgi:acetyl-CoA carboxylase beta subunit